LHEIGRAPDKSLMLMKLLFLFGMFLSFGGIGAFGIVRDKNGLLLALIFSVFIIASAVIAWKTDLEEVGKISAQGLRGWFSPAVSWLYPADPTTSPPIAVSSGPAAEVQAPKRATPSRAVQSAPGNRHCETWGGQTYCD
jgi:hypothetical protein